MFPNGTKPTKFFGSLSIAAIILAFGALGSVTPVYAAAANTAVSVAVPSVADAAPLPGAHLETNSLNLSAPAQASSAPQTDSTAITDPRYYTVQPGDTLAGIAKKFKISEQNLEGSNPQLDQGNVAQSGEVLVIPPTKDLSYTIQQGDNLTMIAKEFGVDLQSLLAANTDLANPSLIYPGEKVIIPSTLDVLYTVQSGDYMAKISRTFEVTLSDLIIANPQVKNPSLIYPGQTLLIPSSHEVIYVVQAGNSLSGIAKEYGVSIAELMKANPAITNPSLIRTGMELVIPIAVEGKYVVLPGDTLWTIAQRFNVSVQDLLKANPQITDPDLIYVGEVLTIP
jgi:LysM repeat protein